MGSDVGLGLWPCPHDFSHFILCHLVLAKTVVIDKHSSADLICNSGSEENSPRNAEYDVERDAHGFYSTELLVSAEEVDACASCGNTVEKESEWQISCVLLLRLCHEVSVWIVLDLLADGVIRWHFLF